MPPPPTNGTNINRMIGGTVLPRSQDCDRRLLIENMITKYSGGLSPPTANNISKKPQREDLGNVVLLTGSTGNLGSEILKLLCSDNVNVAKVYALNRHSSEQSIYQRHVAQLKSKSVDVEFLKSPKLVFLEGDTALPNFDLDLDVYEEVCFLSLNIKNYARQRSYSFAIPLLWLSITPGPSTCLNVWRSSSRV